MRERHAPSLNHAQAPPDVVGLPTRDHCAIIVFAKAPVAGLAKTRLAKDIGADAAARLAARMLSETVGQAVQAGLGPVQLCCTPDCLHPAFSDEQARHGLALSEQGEGDLGARMRRAFEQALQHHARVLLIGTDAPALQAAHLTQAAQALHTHDAVFGPALDGGYVLVGLSRSLPGLFDSVAWSTGEVMAQTRERLEQAGAAWHELEAMADVDEVADLAHVPAAWMVA